VGVHILLIGGSGFFGRAATEAWLAAGDQVTIGSRDPSGVASRLSDGAETVCTGDREEMIGAMERADAVVNLAGAPLIDKRWTAARKALLRKSRVDYTAALVELLADVQSRPALWINASAVGYYGDTGARAVVDEESAAGEDFMATLCVDWEAAASPASAFGVRVVYARFGILLGRGGGALAKMLPLFRAGLGGKVAGGAQGMSWIHIDDALSALRWCMDHSEIRGPVNVVGPSPTSNAEFTRALAAAVRRPAWFPVPRVVAQLAFGEAAVALVDGQRARPVVLERTGFGFAYRSLESAFDALLGG